MLARAGAKRVDGFDVSLEAVEHARARTGELAEFAVGDLKRIPYGDDSFDLITCFEAIEHVDDPFRALDELRRVATPSGVLLVSTPNKGVYAEGNPHHLRELSSDEFEAAVRERFRHVRILRQQTHSASLLGGDETFALHDSSIPLEVQVRKVAGAIPGQELYTVAAASDDQLPELPEFAVVGSALDVADRIRQAEAWKQRAVLAEAAAARERAEARASEQARLSAEAARAETEQARDAALGELAARRSALGRVRAMLGTLRHRARR
jgi:SAM-dependent methyltransferase